MFTGIVQAIGAVQKVIPHAGDVQLVITVNGTYLSTTQVGDSIAVNGCCLTVTRLTEHEFTADVSQETLRCTTLSDWQVGRRVNLEQALRMGQSLGGHWVLGHVDGTAAVLARTAAARSECMRFSLPPALSRYVASKGSVTIDGVSLTVNEVVAATEPFFTVNIVPHTLAATVLGDYSVTQRVNIEVDVLARYVERLQQASE